MGNHVAIIARKTNRMKMAVLHKEMSNQCNGRMVRRHT